MTSFVLPIEAETCAIPDGDDAVFFGGSDKKLYTFPASDIPSTPKVSVAGETEEKIVGAAVYQSSMKDYYYLIASEEAISVYSKKFENVGTIEIEGGNGFELSDIAIYQGDEKTARRLAIQAPRQQFSLHLDHRNGCQKGEPKGHQGLE